MNMIIGKKQIVMAALVAALGLAVFANWYYVGANENGKDLTVAVNEKLSKDVISSANAVEEIDNDVQNEYFETARLNRLNARDEAVETLQNILDTCDSESEAAINAAKELSNINTGMMLETDIENLITAKIGSDCICTIETNGIEVVIEEALLDDDAVLAISDIISSNCGTVENIRITGA